MQKTSHFSGFWNVQSNIKDKRAYQNNNWKLLIRTTKLSWDTTI